MKALLMFYLEKSWIRLALLFAIAILKTGLKLDVEFIVYALAGWFLLGWNHGDGKANEYSFIATVAPSHRHILFVKYIVPALLIAAPVLMALMDPREPLHWYGFLKALVISGCLAGFSVVIAKPKNLIILAVVFYLALADVHDHSMIMLLLTMIVLAYFSLQTIYGDRIRKRDLRLGAAVAIILAFLLNSRYEDLVEKQFGGSSQASSPVPGHRKHHNTFISVKGDDDEEKFNVNIDHSDTEPDPAGWLPEVKALDAQALGDTQGMLKMFAGGDDKLRKQLLEKLSSAAFVPSAVLIAGLENTVFRNPGQYAAGSDACSGLCEKLAAYAGENYHAYTNPDMKARYSQWLKEGSSEEKSYMASLGVMTKIKRHGRSLGKSIEGISDKPLQSTRQILDEISDGIKAFEAASESETGSEATFNKLVAEELQLESPAPSR